jgi:hypothetical protein
MNHELDVGDDDNDMWQTVRLIAGAALLVLAGLSISLPSHWLGPSDTTIGSEDQGQ